MKAKKLFAALAMGLMFAACTPKAEATAEGEEPENLTAAQVAPSAAQTDSVSYLLGVWFGNFMKSNGFGDKVNIGQFRKGMADLLNAKGNPADSAYIAQFKVDPKQMDALFNDYIMKKSKEKALLNKESEAKFFAAVDKKEGIQKTESGLRYQIEEEGNPVKITARDTVAIRYKLSLPDGTVMQEITEDQEPYEAPASMNVPGFVEGLQLVGEGGKIHLYIPSELAYGERGARGAIEPNTPLEFVVTVAEVKPFIEKEAEPAE